jgi:alkanesulfonate monooxygenase SsuD/methylene tetrahydromethanopterin reductase-like flavin-dependent oxidoreductase (luciferase family)
MPRNAILHDDSQLKLALFGANCSSGRTYSSAPERWDASWENNVRLAQIADDAGIEAMIPIARWKGYGGETNPNGMSWESITWAAGLLAATKRINVFATVHVPLNHPVVAAKQMATTDHIGGGRFGVNVVCGWNDDEFQMFGVTKQEHEARYEQGTEWWSIVRRIWAGDEPFDFEGKHYSMDKVEGAPRPVDGEAPIMMNAGISASGRDFALRYSNMHFDAVRLPEDSSSRIAETRRMAGEIGRTLQVWTPVGIVCRPTQQEAVDYTHHIIEHADTAAVGNLTELYRRDRGDQHDRDDAFTYMGEGPVERRVLARGNFCAIGDADHVARQIARLRNVGFDGLALNFVNYLDEFPYFAQEVLPRLESLTLRKPFSGSGIGI